ncbi:transient receptor potential cation channel subfamily M member 5-like [Mytilus edulis]|uniref:transient receptor potential cation channel subfamily M member 5-like n=1 Tax=Mytilus edulis TaxID=6550 RepID=UPI0039F0031E
MFPNSEPGFQLFKDIIYMPYWQLYGELFLDNIAGKEPSTCTDDALLYRNGTLARCPEVNQINTLLLAVYMVVTHIILVNILIAMFSHTFTKVQDNNELVWKYHRFSLIREYYDRSSLIPPLIIISHIKKCVMCIACKLFKKRETKNKFKISNKPESEQLAILERYSVYRHLNSSIRLRRYHATNTEAEKDGFDTSYSQEADISLEEQFDLLTSEVYKMQKNQEETMKDVKEIKSTKQNLLIIDLNGGSANRTYKI